MLELQRLRRDHEAAVLAFELENRAYFAESVGDRGDAFHQELAEWHSALLAEQETGVCVLHVLVDEDETVVGRFNLYDLVDGTAEIGYRVAQRISGRGVATSGLRNLCRIAGEDYGPRSDPHEDPQHWGLLSSRERATHRRRLLRGYHLRA